MMSDKKDKKQPKNPQEQLKDLAKKVEKAPQKKTYLDSQTDEEAITEWENEINKDK